MRTTQIVLISSFVVVVLLTPGVVFASGSDNSNNNTDYTYEDQQRDSQQQQEEQQPSSNTLVSAPSSEQDNSITIKQTAVVIQVLDNGTVKVTDPNSGQLLAEGEPSDQNVKNVIEQKQHEGTTNKLGSDVIGVLEAYQQSLDTGSEASISKDMQSPLTEFFCQSFPTEHIYSQLKYDSSSADQAGTFEGDDESTDRLREYKDTHINSENQHLWNKCIIFSRIDEIKWREYVLETEIAGLDSLKN